MQFGISPVKLALRSFTDVYTCLHWMSECTLQAYWFLGVIFVVMGGGSFKLNEHCTASHSQTLSD